MQIGKRVHVNVNVHHVRIRILVVAMCVNSMWSRVVCGGMPVAVTGQSLLTISPSQYSTHQYRLSPGEFDHDQYLPLSIQHPLECRYEFLAWFLSHTFVSPCTCGVCENGGEGDPSAFGYVRARSHA